MKPGNHPEMKSGRMILKAKQLHYSGGSKVRVPVCLVEGWNHQPKRTKTRGWVPPKLVVGIDGVPLFQGGFFRIHVKGWNHQLKIVPDNIPSQKKKDIYIYKYSLSLSPFFRFHGPSFSWVVPTNCPNFQLGFLCSNPENHQVTNKPPKFTCL